MITRFALFEGTGAVKIPAGHLSVDVTGEIVDADFRGRSFHPVDERHDVVA